MPSEKSFRASVRKQKRNRSVRSETRTYVSKALKAIVDEAPDSEESVKRALKALDTTAKRGVIHRNNADRRKSRLMRRLNAAAANDATA